MNCPKCYQTLEASLSIEGKKESPIKNGDKAVCLHCGECLMFDGYKFSIMTVQEALKLSNKQRNLMLNARQNILWRNRINISNN